eukprot:12056-Heterococcus_DN1.PRE.3
MLSNKEHSKSYCTVTRKLFALLFYYNCLPDEGALAAALKVSGPLAATASACAFRAFEMLRRSCACGFRLY